MPPTQPLVAYLIIELAVGGIILLIFLALLVWLWVQVARVRRASKVLSGGGLYGLDETLRTQSQQIREVLDRLQEAERRLDGADQRIGTALRHVKVLRFNPFLDAGGDQSFVIAMVNDTGGGIVVTGLHGRSSTRVYAKPLERGASPYPLSEEEISAIRSAFGVDAAASKAQS